MDRISDIHHWTFHEDSMSHYFLTLNLTNFRYIRIFSLGPLLQRTRNCTTGNPGTSALPKSPGLLEMSKALAELVTETEKTAESFEKQHRGLNAMGDVKRYYRFNVEQGLQHVGLAEFKKKAVIADATQNYMTSQRQKEIIRNCAINLRDKRCTFLVEDFS